MDAARRGPSVIGPGERPGRDGDQSDDTCCPAPSRAFATFGNSRQLAAILIEEPPAAARGWLHARARRLPRKRPSAICCGRSPARPAARDLSLRLPAAAPPRLIAAAIPTDPWPISRPAAPAPSRREALHLSAVPQLARCCPNYPLVRFPVRPFLRPEVLLTTPGAHSTQTTCSKPLDSHLTETLNFALRSSKAGVIGSGTPAA